MAQPEDTDEQVESYLQKLAARSVLATVFRFGKGLSFKDVPDIAMELIAAAPGAEKSKLATQIASDFWGKRQKPTLYLMLSHESMKERLRFIESDTKLEGKQHPWNHYEGHPAFCRISKWANVGYSGAKCNCGRRAGLLSADRPTLAALEVLFSNEITGFPTHKPVEDFPLWIIDEIDFGRFVVGKSASERDLRAVVARYPGQTNPQQGHPLQLQPVKELAQAFLSILQEMEESDQDRLNGPELYRRLDQVLGVRNSSVAELSSQLKPLVGHLPTGRWAGKGLPEGKEPTLQGQPRNFPPFLVPIFREEVEDFHRPIQFNPRIHLVNQGDRGWLRMRWRREILEREYGELLILDATAEFALLERVFSSVPLKQNYYPALPKWPCNVHVQQWGDSVVSQTVLGRQYDNDDHAYDSSKLEVWFQRIKEALEPFDRKLRVGIITHKALHEQLEQRVKSWGFNTKSMYYYNLRGSNEFEKSRILVILGCPIPNLSGFEEEYQAFFYDDEGPIDFHRNQKALDLEMRQGRKYKVQVYGVWNPPASEYYWQKCQAELYQAVHRIRPNIKKKYDRHILLFTNMPVQGVEVENIITCGTKYNDEVADLVRELLADREEVSTLEVASMRAKDNQKPRNVQRTINNNGENIAILAGAFYLKGGPGLAGKNNRFAKFPTSYK